MERGDRRGLLEDNRKKEPLLKRLLARGYFPRELPPPFTTRSLGEVAMRDPAATHSALTASQGPTQPAIHDLARVGTLRRTLGIPNPISHYRLSKELADHWEEIERVITISEMTRSKPTDDPTNERALRRLKLLEELPDERALVRSTSRYIVRTDILSFYHSIYTHSIPWAIHDKAQAKANQRDDSLIGNRLDKIIRGGQDNQTIGIPVGPDTSLVIAEILLCSIDAQLQEDMNGFRYVDDYECGFSKREDAESALAKLQRHLASYELSLNPRKTSIIQLPHRLENSWVNELRIFAFHQNERKQRHDIIRFFDRVFELAAMHPDESVMLYGVSRTHAVQVCPGNLKLFFYLLMQSMLIEPGVLPYVLHILAEHADSLEPERDRLKACLEDTIARHTSSLHGSEVAWAVWGALLFDIPLSSEVVKRVTLLNDPIPALLTLDLRDKGLVDGDCNVDGWAQAMTKDGLSQRTWMLSYEAFVKGWLDPVDGEDYVGTDEAFCFFRKNDVHFYDYDNAREAMLAHAASAARDREY